jgi:hypothetical protein
VIPKKSIDNFLRRGSNGYIFGESGPWRGIGKNLGREKIKGGGLKGTHTKN